MVVNGLRTFTNNGEISTNEMSSNIRIEKICEWCGKQFTAQTTVTRFCSKRCAEHSYKERMRQQKIQLTNSTNISHQGKRLSDSRETAQVLGMTRQGIYKLIYRGNLVAAKGAKSAEDVEFISVADAMEKYSLTRVYHYVKTYKITKFRCGKYVKLNAKELAELFNPKIEL